MIYVDADSMPGQAAEVLYAAAIRRKMPVLLVACRYFRPHPNPLIQSRVCDTGPDAADDLIVELVQPGDLVITHDIPLADRVITKQAHALSPRGVEFLPANIKTRLGVRDMMEEIRSTGGITSGPPPFSPRDREQFANAVDRFLTRIQKG